MAVRIAVKDLPAKLPGRVDPKDSTRYVFDTVHSTNQLGNKTQWTIIVRVLDQKKDEFVSITPDFYKGQLNKDYVGWIKVYSGVIGGKVRETPPTIISKGKNIGKANETNVFTQALRDAFSKYNDQIKKSKSQDVVVDGVILYPPMLAQNITAQKKPIDYKQNVYIQPKYNGVRVVSVMGESVTDNNQNTKEELTEMNNIIMYSRTRKLYFMFDYIRKELAEIFDWAKSEFAYERKESDNGEVKNKLYLDGEIYKTGVNLQLIAGIANREITPEDIGEYLDYYIFDCFFPDKELVFSERLKYLQRIKSKFPDLKYVKFAPTHSVDSWDETKALYDSYLAEGLEGAIMRLDQPYKYSYNSYHTPWLLKIKPVLDEEFKIVGYKAAEKGKAQGDLMFIVETDQGKQFSVTLGMPLGEKKALYKKMSTVCPGHGGKTYFEAKYKGKLLTVMFDEWSKDKIPLRARTDGIVIRDYE